MFHQKALFAAFVWLGASLTVFGQPNYVVELSGASSASGQYFPYCIGSSSPNCFGANLALSAATSVAVTGPSGIDQILAKPDGTAFYLIGSSGVYLQTVGPTFTQPQTISAGFSSSPTAAAITPNGQYLLIAADRLYAFSTATGSETWVLPLQATPAAGIAVSEDSNYAYVVSANGLLAQYRLSTAQLVTTLATSGGATAVTLSPFGFVYVSAGNAIYEVNPATMALTPSPGGKIGLFFQPGPLRFTADGSFAYSASVNAGSGGALLKLNLSTYGVTTSEGATSGGHALPQFSDVYIASDTEVFALSPSTGTIWDVNTTSTQVTASQDTILPTAQTQNVIGAALSNEVPSNSPSSSPQGARSIFLLGAGSPPTISEVSLVNNALVSQIQAGVSIGTLQYLSIPPQTGAAGFLLLGNQQTLAAGQISAPLIARVLNANGSPIYNLQVTFSSASGGPSITTASQRTNSDGYVQTTITAPSAPGVYTVTLTTSDNTTANNGVATFTVTVAGGSVGTGGTGGTGGNGASSQVSIVSGDGQLIQEGFATTQGLYANPLTMLVTDTMGNPLSGVPVTFTITNGPGALIVSTFSPTTTNSGTALSTTTDTHGYAYADFQAQQLAGNVDTQQAIVNANTQFGSVNFTVTTLHVIVTEFGTFGQPQIDVITPTAASDYTVNLVEGVPLPNAIEEQFYANAVNVGSPISGISLYTQNPNSATLSPGGTGYVAPVAVCQGSTLSDQNGIAHCTLVTTCSAGTGTYNLLVSAGNYVYQPANGITVKISPSGPTKVAIALGNNQTGAPGQLLPTSLVVTVTDACGNAVNNQTVTWKVTSGSGQLQNIIAQTNGLGQSTARLQLGSTPGTVQVTASVGTVSAVFSFTNQLNIVVASITATSGNGQSVVVGQPFANPVIFTVLDTNNNPVSGATVSLSVSPSGSATIITSNGILTNTLGQVSVSVTAGSTAQTITITASTATVSGTATLTAAPMPPSITPSSFANAASGAVGLAPCGLSTVTGNGVAPNVTGVISGVNPIGPLSYTLGGFSMSVNGIPAPIQAISNISGVQQVNFQTPCEVAPGSATVVLLVNGATTTITGVQINQVEPGIFYFTGSNGKPYGVVISAADGSYVTPSNYARRGGNYFILVTGLGQANPTLVSNNTGSDQNVALPVVVGVSGAGVPVISAQYSPGLVGVYAVEFTIPATTSTGAPWPTGPDQQLAIYATLPNGQQVFGVGAFLAGIQ